MIEVFEYSYVYIFKLRLFWCLEVVEVVWIMLRLFMLDVSVNIYFLYNYRVNKYKKKLFLIYDEVYCVRRYKDGVIYFSR